MVTEESDGASRELIGHIRWYVRLRWLLVAVTTFPWLTTLIIGEGDTGALARDSVLLVFGIGSNAFFHYLSRRIGSQPSHVRKLAAAIIICDILMVTYFAYTRGGVESRSTLLYAIPITTSMIMFSRRIIYLTTACAIMSYLVLIYSSYLGIIDTHGGLTEWAQNDFAQVTLAAIYISSLLLIYAVVVDFVDRLISQERAQTKRSLDELNRAQAMTHLGSWERNIKTNEARWSDEMFNIFGVSQSNGPLTLPQLERMIHPDDLQKFLTSYDTAISKRKPVSCNFRLLRNFEIRYIRYEARPRSIDSKDPVIYGTVRDITETRLIEESKNDFVSLASHQLRTPATVVKQYLGLVLEGFASSPEQQRELIKKAYDGNERQLAIVNDLLSVVHIDAGKVKLDIEPIDLVKLINDTCEGRAPKLLSENQKIVFGHKRPRVIANVDDDQLRLCLENLIDNASKYSPKDTTVSISLTRSKKGVKIAVSDEGVGIPHGDIPSIFLKFTRVDNPLSVSAGGTGLGLYWVKKIVELHGGTIEVSSRINRGTTFTILLPQ